MIQRIQSVLLLLAGTALVLLLNDSFKFAELEQKSEVVAEAGSNTAFADGMFTLDDHLIITILTIFSAFIAFVTILLFKNRNLQINLTKSFIFLSLISNALIFYLMYNELGVVQENIDVDLSIKTGMFMPLIAIVLGYFALRYIQKDDKLVKSMDRLR